MHDWVEDEKGAEIVFASLRAGFCCGIDGSDGCRYKIDRAKSSLGSTTHTISTMYIPC